MKIERIIRSKRRTIALYIINDASLIVRAPLKTSNELINKVVLKHRDWIKKKKREIQIRNHSFTKKEYVDGESFLYLGEYYRLRLVEDQERPLDFKEEFYLSKKYLLQAKELFIEWYKEKSYENIYLRVEWYAERRGFKYHKIRITTAQKRWGSCTSGGNINFSWRLIMAPLVIVDYVVVHELVHLEEKNHSRVFWNKVGRLMPDYKRYQEWLKKNGHLLRL